MRVFITGATGFIGGHVAQRLAQSKHELRCLVRKTSDVTFLREIGDGHSGLTLEVSQDDVALAKAFIASEHTSNNVRVVSRDDINSGVAMLVEGGRKTGVNTLESRFQKAQKLLRTRVGATLFNDDN